MHRHVATAVLSALTLAVAGCGGGESGGTASGGGSDASGDAAKQDKQKLKVGDETTLKGLGDGSMKVRVVKIEDPLPLPPAKGLLQEKPRAGRRFVGVHVRLTNLGKEPYGDAPLNGSRLVTDVKDGANPTILLGGKCRSKDGTQLRMKPGATKKLCLPFQARKRAKVEAFEFTLDSGQGPESGRWSVR
jgi:hypothetical protein